MLREDFTTDVAPNVFDCEQDAPQSPLPPAPQLSSTTPSDVSAEETAILSIRQRNTRSIGSGIPYDPAREYIIVDPDMPTLVEIDSDDEIVPPIDLYPKYNTVPAHIRGIADSSKTVHADSTIILTHGDFFLQDGDKLLHTKYMMRGPPRPSQLLREKHAMHCYSLDTAADPVQCWMNHCQDPVKQAFFCNSPQCWS